MPLDRTVERFVAALAAGRTIREVAPTMEARRTVLADLMRFSGPKIAVEQSEDRLIPTPSHSIPVRIYSPQGAAEYDMPAVIFFHGGGLVAGSIDTHDNIARALSHFGRCRVVSVDYRLAPEHRFPAALEDAITAVRHVCENSRGFGISRSRIGVCGDSAGAALAAAACQSLRDCRVALQLLICPILDFGSVSQFPPGTGEGYLIDEATLEQDLMLYLPAGADPADPRVSPLREPDFRNLPPAIVHTAEFDPLLYSGLAYFNRMQAAGSRAEYHCHAGMIHLFYGLGTVIPYVRTAYEQIGAQICRALA
jgi:acetyl esterase/lipase